MKLVRASRRRQIGSFSKSALRGWAGAGRRALHTLPPIALDSILYGVSAVFALGVSVQSLPALSKWGSLAVGPYVAACAIAATVAGRGSLVTPLTVHAIRWILALGLAAGALFVPLAIEVSYRTTAGAEAYAQPEAAIVEAAGRSLIVERNPYLPIYGVAGEDGTVVRSPFPYLPAMLVFGLSRGIMGNSVAADSRVAFTVFTVVIAGLVMALGSGVDKLRLLQPMLVLPTGAMILVSGGDDVPVLALTLLALVLVRRHRPLAGGIIIGLAVCMKQMAWPILPLLALGARDQHGRRAWATVLGSALAVAGAVVLPFFAWDPKAIIADVIRFPLGLGPLRTTAASPTLGHLLGAIVPSARAWVAWVGPVTLLGMLGALCIFRPPPSAARAAAYSAGLLTLAVALGAATRFGLLTYGVDLAIWAWALSSADDGLGLPPVQLTRTLATSQAASPT